MKKNYDIFVNITERLKNNPIGESLKIISMGVIMATIFTSFLLWVYLREYNAFFEIFLNQSSSLLIIIFLISFCFSFLMYAFLIFPSTIHYSFAKNSEVLINIYQNRKDKFFLFILPMLFFFLVYITIGLYNLNYNLLFMGNVVLEVILLLIIFFYIKCNNFNKNKDFKLYIETIFFSGIMMFPASLFATIILAQSSGWLFVGMLIILLVTFLVNFLDNRPYIFAVISVFAIWLLAIILVEPTMKIIEAKSSNDENITFKKTSCSNIKQQLNIDINSSCTITCQYIWRYGAIKIINYKGEILQIPAEAISPYKKLVSNS